MFSIKIIGSRSQGFSPFLIFEYRIRIFHTRRGEIQVRTLVTERSPTGTVFIPFHFAEAAANELTLDARDPQAKIPDYKMSAVALEKLN